MSHPRESALVAKHVFKQVSLPAGPSATEKHKMLHILSDISMSISDGESVAIIGASGSGKSTLLGILAGLDLPSEGQVYFYDKALHQMDEEQRAQIRRSEIGFIFQQFLLVPSLTALENVMLPAELSDDPNLRSNARALALEWLEKVGLQHRLEHFPNQLSGGEQQRVAIARAFITQPKLLFADEPSANLDTENGKRVEDLLFELNQTAKTTLVLVTHDPELAQRCERTLVLHGGKLEQEIKKLHGDDESDIDRLDEIVSEGIANAF